MKRIRKRAPNTVTSNRILILTHTDVSSDSRIIKTQQVARLRGRTTLSLGVSDPTTRGYAQTSDALNIVLKARRIRDYISKRHSLRRPLQRFFFTVMYLEVATKMLVKGIAFRPRIVHCNDWFVLPIAVLIKFFSRSSLVYDAHELESETTPDSNVPGKLVLRVETLLWFAVDFFTTVSPSIQDWYQKNLGPKPSQVILNSPVLLEELAQIESLPKMYFREKFNIPPSSQIYLYIGMLSVGRGIDTILEAFRRTKTDSVAIFLGQGNYRERIIHSAESRGNVFVHERVDHTKVIEIARNADFGLCLIENVSLSDYFCIPNKLLEYAFAGLEIVASDLPEIQRVVEEFEIGKCFDNSPEQLMKVLEWNKKTGTVSQIKNAKLEPLSWQIQAKKLEKIFEQFSEAENK